MRSGRIGTIRRAILVTILACGGLVSTQAVQAPAADKVKSNPVEHAVAGTVESVDNAAKTVSIKTADGTVKVVKVTDKTTVEGMKAGAKYTALGAEKGAHVAKRLARRWRTSSSTSDRPPDTRAGVGRVLFAPLARRTGRRAGWTSGGRDTTIAACPTSHSFSPAAFCC
jgi:cytoskeletal protein RodZ